MKEITEAYKGWRAAKEAAQLSCEREMNYSLARKLEACQMFEGSEDMELLAKKLFSERGIEFATRFNYPTIEVFRSFKKYDPQRLGFYIDAGEITLHEKQRVFLVGNTQATLYYAEAELDRIVCMCGASCTINATGFSVIKAEADSQSTIKINKAQHAQIL